MTVRAPAADQQTRLSQSTAGAQWRSVGIYHHHGVNLPLGALRCGDSGGIGEFLDLIPLVDWCDDVGFDVIQLLPLNDSGQDPSPYNSLSAFALHPIYLKLSALAGIDSDPELLKSLAALEALDASKRVAYSAVLAEKEHFLRLYYDRVYATLKEDSAYQNFVADNPWLRGYSAFKALKERYQWRAWKEWPSQWQHSSLDAVGTLDAEMGDSILRHQMIQYLCFQQLQEAHAYASAKDVLLKGDIPILISPDSADVWMYPQYFSMDFAAGAPPDAYAEQGQNWGFPLYRWDAMESDDFRWWQQRLDVAAALYDVYRLDHIVGFFRLWAVPHGHSGEHGHFVPSDENAWLPLGTKLLDMMLSRCPMLPIGEDLGCVPPEVRQRLRELGICSTKVMRWERLWNEDSRFISLSDYPPESMTTVSTHDSETLAQWWEQQADEAEAYCAHKHWEYSPALKAEQRQDILRDSHHSNSLFHINLFQEYLALEPTLCWPSVEDERINVPGTVDDSNWTYRLHSSIGDIAGHGGLRQQIRGVLD